MDQENTTQHGLEWGHRGLRSTPQRRAVYDALYATTSHPTADELFRQVRQSMPGISLATVYNCLEAFCRAGLAMKLPGNGAAVRYDARVDNHLHMCCEKSGAVRDVPDNLGSRLLDHLPPDVLERIETDLGFKVRQVQIELVGEYQS